MDHAGLRRTAFGADRRGSCGSIRSRSSVVLFIGRLPRNAFDGGRHAGGTRPVTVFYVTDGAKLAPGVDGVCRLLAGTKGASSDCAVAAVDVPDRTAFLTPTASSLGRNGLDTGKAPRAAGAAELAECLDKTVKPAVSRALEGREIRHALMGHSFGGLFALSTMVSRPDLFDAWVAADPSLWWDGGVLLKRLEARAGAGAPDAFIYIGFATALRKTEGTTAERNLARAERFRTALEDFAGQRARRQVDEYPRETHGTIAVPVFHEAMKRLLIGEPRTDAVSPVPENDDARPSREDRALLWSALRQNSAAPASIKSQRAAWPRAHDSGGPRRPRRDRSSCRG